MRQPFKNRPELEVGTNLYNLRLTPFFPVLFFPSFAPFLLPGNQITKR